MEYEKFIQPKEMEIGGRKFAISKIPAMEAMSIYSELAKAVSANGALGMTMLPSSVNKQILGYVALCDKDGIWVSLSTDSIINEIFRDDFGDLQQVIIEMVEENFGFFVSGKLLDKLVHRTLETESA